MVEEMLRLAHRPDHLKRLAKVLEDRLGHDLSFAVERGKIATNTDDARAEISLEPIEKGFSIPLTQEGAAATLASFAARLDGGARETLAIANMDAAQIDRVIYVGGSSLMSLVADQMRLVFPRAEHGFSEVFTAVTDGLAIASARYGT